MCKFAKNKNSSGKPHIYRVLIYSSLLLNLFFISPSFTHSENHYPKNILVLHSFHKGQKWNDSIAKGIEAGFTKTGNDIQLYYEYMDSKRIFDNQHLKNLYILYKHKFANRRFDAVITSDDQAFNFMLNYHYSLLSETPVIFCGVKYFDDYTLYGQHDFTGVVETIDIKGTLELALELNQKTQKALVIVDKTPSNIATIQAFIKIMRPFMDRLTFTFIEDLEMQELLFRLESLPSNTIVILVSFNVDKSGRAYTLEESTRQISQHSPVPVYSFWDSYLGHGVLGGMMVNGFSQGKTASQMALRILNGEKVEMVPLIKQSPNKYMFDFKQLSRFGIKTDKLPDESFIINFPKTLYTEHKRLIWAVAGSIVGMAFVILVLVLNIFSRKKAESALKRYSQRLQILHKTDRAILEMRSTERIAHDVLKYVRELFPCQRASVVLFDYQNKEAFVLAVNVGNKTQIDEGATFPLKAFDTESLQKGEIVRVNDLNTLRQPTVVDLALQSEKIRAYVRIPLISDTGLIGSLNFGSENSAVFEIEKITIARETATSLALAIQNMLLVNEVIAHEKDLKRMSSMVITSQENVRKRISIELHDEMGQALTAINLNLSIIENKIPKDSSVSLSKRLSETKAYIERLSDQVHNLSHYLWPPMLGDLGLISALRSYINGVAERSGINIKLEFNNCDDRMSEEVETVLYRITQEALNNVVKHAKASNVLIRISRLSDKISAQIIDDGKGFIIKSNRSDYTSEGGLGIIGMKERLSIIGGKFKIRSSPEQGTSIMIEVPHPGEKKYEKN